MTQESAAPELRLRRGSVVWQGRATWLVYDLLTPDRIAAFPIRRANRRRHRAEVPIEAPAEQLLTRIIGVPVINPRRRQILPRADLEHAGELGGLTMCRVSQVMARIAAADALEAKWDGDRRHKRAALAECCAV